ncbi:MAG TPA: hypothetical protein PKI03_31730, partial [Pseudomonadota bacterium]|nr:hypothetical protein [Pseudomonadota bacterium]
MATLAGMIPQTHAPGKGSVDALIVTAVKDELDVVLSAETDWQQHKDPSGYPYYTRKSANGLLFAAARATDMGPELAANIATRLVLHLRPRCIAMVGVCAGHRDKVHQGDVVVAERVFRYDAGKLKAFRKGEARQEEVFQDLRTYNLNPVWRQQAEDFPATWAQTIKQHRRPLPFEAQEHWLLFALAQHLEGRAAHPSDLSERDECCPNWSDVLERLERRRLVVVDAGLSLTEEGKRWVANFRMRYPKGPKLAPSEPKLHVAPIATGGMVREDPDIFSIIHKYARKTLGLEMEASAIAAVAEIEGVEKFIIAKAVQDFADADKDDRFRLYAIEASYRFVAEFLGKNLPPTVPPAPFVLPQLDTESFTGRTEELQALERQLLGKDTDRLCSIAGLSGSGGIGKSALASHFAATHRDKFPDGVYGLRVDGKDPDILAREFARLVGCIIDEDDDRDASAIMQS